MDFLKKLKFWKKRNNERTPAARRPSALGQQIAKSVCATVQTRRSKMARVRALLKCLVPCLKGCSTSPANTNISCTSETYRNIIAQYEAQVQELKNRAESLRQRVRSDYHTSDMFCFACVTCEQRYEEFVRKQRMHRKLRRSSTDSGLLQRMCFGLRKGKRLGEYKTIKELGKGGFGNVYLARRKSAGGPLVAVKVTNKCEENIELQVFQRTVGHPYLLQLVSFFETEKKWNYVMEYMDGGTVATKLDDAKQFSEELTRFYAAELTVAVELLHKCGIIHRDIKPQNILLDKDGHCKLGDFGICGLRIFHGMKTRTRVGTIPYVAPEVIWKEPYGPEVDWWSLGIVMYEMMLGETPFNLPTDVFYHEIFYKCVEFPPYLTKNAVSILSGFLNIGPATRLGSDGESCAIRQHPFFESIDWTAVEERRMDPPQGPQIKELRTADPERSGYSIDSERTHSFTTTEQGPLPLQPRCQLQMKTLSTADPEEDDISDNSGSNLSFVIAEEEPQVVQEVRPPCQPQMKEKCVVIIIAFLFVVFALSALGASLVD